MDPNLQRIIEHNVENIQKDNLGTVIVQANSYLEFVHLNKDKNKKQQELDKFIEEIKVMSNKFKLKKLKT